MAKLLTRQEFEARVFARDKHTCVFCPAKADDAHHLLDRKLFKDGGYYLNNGVSVCNPCHLLCENDTYSVEDARAAAKITEIILPVDFDPALRYDKWGNPILEDGTRVRGPLFFDKGVQTTLKDKLAMYEGLYKYPSTPHHPLSRSRTEDDKVLTTDAHLVGKVVVISEKMDGESATLYPHHYHARSLDSRHHASRDWIKSFHAQKKGDIPEGFRVNGENMYAEHSIRYDNLPSYFLGFSMWDDTNTCLTWDETLTYFELIGITPVKVFYRGVYDPKVMEQLIADMDPTKQEGFVIRVDEPFHFDDFAKNMAKYVRPKHVQTEQHWMHAEIKANGLADAAP